MRPDVALARLGRYMKLTAGQVNQDDLSDISRLDNTVLKRKKKGLRSFVTRKAYSCHGHLHANQAAELIAPAGVSSAGGRLDESTV